MKKIQRPVYSQKAASNSIVKACPICGGTGLKTWLEVPEYDSTPVWVGDYCPRCKNRIRVQDITGIPNEFHDVDIQKFRFDAYQVETSDFQKVIMSMFQDYEKKWSAAGKGLYLWSEMVGSGKTFLSCCLAKSIMIKYDVKMRFITVPDYLAEVGDSYKRERGEADTSQIYRECPLLVFDDIGSQKEGKWQDQEIFKIVNDRQSNGRVTIYTANMPPEKLNINSRTQSRIIKSSIVLQMPEESIRQKKAREEQDKFLNEILSKR